MIAEELGKWTEKIENQSKHDYLRKSKIKLIRLMTQKRNSPEGKKKFKEIVFSISFFISYCYILLGGTTYRQIDMVISWLTCLKCVSIPGSLMRKNKENMCIQINNYSCTYYK